MKTINKITLSLLALFFVIGVSNAEGQEYNLDAKTVYTCDFESTVEPFAGSFMSGADFINYCYQNQETINPAGRIYWDDEFVRLGEENPGLTFSDEDMVVTIENVEMEATKKYEYYEKHFSVRMEKDEISYYEYLFTQVFHVYLYDQNDPRIGQPYYGQLLTDNDKEGATVNELDYITDIAVLRGKPVTGFNISQLEPISCFKEDELIIVRHEEPLDIESDDPCVAKFLIKYRLYDAALVDAMGYVYESRLATIDETQILHRAVHYSGSLRTQTFTEDTPPPPTDQMLTISYLESQGANIFSYCPANELEVGVDGDDEFIREGEYLRTYYVAPKDCDNEDQAFFTQKWFYRNENLEPFRLADIRDVSEEGANDGGATIVYPPYDMGCQTIVEPNIIDKIKQSYSVDWYNKTTDELIRVYGNDPDVEDPFVIDRLSKGDWEVKVYANCPNCELSDQTPVFESEFKIDAVETKLYITFGVALYNGADNFQSAFGLHRYVDDELPEGEEYEGDRHLYSVTNATFPGDPSGLTLDLNSLHHRYEWEVERGTFNFDHQQMVTGGSDPGVKPFAQWVQEYEQSYGEHFTVAKGTSKAGMPRAFIFKRFDNEGNLRDVVRKPLYSEVLKCSDDPNEIFGPTGYTNADSTVVRMINATDDINYTILFENDPEFASAAAARVKITCPLDDNTDPTTFRLGNFGFGEYTFEIPPMASYYNNRINMDSLGYWLDVTASIAVPQNEAYWIFQTIDPETGVAPIDSMGFLPVNDTLTGVGEGFVTFSIAPKKEASLIHTGDSVVERADIYFDENEVVPTNRYKNVFDAEAPVSSIVCDTTGAYTSLYLNIGFNSSDDDGGSGVHYIELYANVDQKGYEMVAQIHPDSIFSYPMMSGTNFEFIGLAVDNVGNKEEYKPFHELVYSLGTPPYDLSLSNDTFEENDPVGTHIGDFSTFDDQNTDNFVYALVDGEGSDDNNLFYISGKQLKTNFDFRCYGTYEYKIRVRTTDITNASLEKTFNIFANQTETIQPTLDYYYLCPGEHVYFGGQLVTEEGVYLDTLSSYLGCDSVVNRIVRFNPAPLTTEVADDLCFGNDYTDNGFNLSADSLSRLAEGWDMQSDFTISIDNYVLNAYECYDTTRLALTLHPAFDIVDDVMVCPTDLPYVYQGASFFTDTIAVFNYNTATGCDSTFTLRLTLNPNYGTQSEDLALGWNWYSTYIDQSNGEGLANLENALNGYGEMIKSKNHFVMFSPELNSWYGDLTEINNTSMFMIKMSDAQAADLIGCYAYVDTITLQPGWTWIGYPLPDNTNVSQLITAIQGGPSDNDMVKSKENFAMFSADYNLWYGSLNTLTPGGGYMYMSNASSNKALNYNNRSRENIHIHTLDIPSVHWVANHGRFADNMTIMGIIALDGKLIESDTLEVGAFVNGEMRGAGRAAYIEEMDAYRIFLTIHGEEGEVVNFRLFDHSRDRERRIRCKEQVVFKPNLHYGTLDAPHRLSFMTDYDRYIQAEICEGEYYTENNFRVFRAGTYFQELVGQQGNDSIVRLDLTVNPVFHVEEEVVATGFPFEYQGVVFDKPGTHVLPFQTAAACDSLWEVTVIPYEGLRELLISPQPATRSQQVSLYFPFTNQEQQGIIVEVYTLSGSLIQAKRPTRFPIELDPFTTAGTYMVKITMGTGEVLTGKLVVR